MIDRVVRFRDTVVGDYAHRSYRTTHVLRLFGGNQATLDMRLERTPKPFPASNDWVEVHHVTFAGSASWSTETDLITVALAVADCGTCAVASGAFPSDCIACVPRTASCFGASFMLAAPDPRSRVCSAPKSVAPRLHPESGLLCHSVWNAAGPWAADWTMTEAGVEHVFESLDVASCTDAPRSMGP